MSGLDLRRCVDPAAWRADEIGGKAGLERALTTGELRAFEGLLEATAHLAELQVTRTSFSSPELDALGGEIKDAVVRGRGGVILTGLDLKRFGLDGYRRIYWFLGRQIGVPAVQSERGDRLGLVRHEVDNSLELRGYTSNNELGFHADYHEVLSLAAVQPADIGGESGLAPSLTLHNMLLERRPDLLEVLYRGHPDGIYCTYSAAFGGRPPVPEGLPYFSCVDGVVSLIFGSHVERLWPKFLEEPLAPDLADALDALRDCAAEPGVAAWFRLEPGEMVFWHNWRVLHARRAFENAPGRERVLMRLWLHMDDHRPAHPRIVERPHEIDRLHMRILSERGGQLETLAS